MSSSKRFRGVKSTKLTQQLYSSSLLSTGWFAPEPGTEIRRSGAGDKESKRESIVDKRAEEVGKRLVAVREKPQEKKKVLARVAPAAATTTTVEPKTRAESKKDARGLAKAVEQAVVYDTLAAPTAEKTKSEIKYDDECMHKRRQDAARRQRQQWREALVAASKKNATPSTYVNSTRFIYASPLFDTDDLHCVPKKRLQMVCESKQGHTASFGLGDDIVDPNLELLRFYESLSDAECHALADWFEEGKKQQEDHPTPVSILKTHLAERKVTAAVEMHAVNKYIASGRLIVHRSVTNGKFKDDRNRASRGMFPSHWAVLRLQVEYGIVLSRAAEAEFFHAAGIHERSLRSLQMGDLMSACGRMYALSLPVDPITLSRDATYDVFRQAAALRLLWAVFRAECDAEFYRWR